MTRPDDREVMRRVVERDQAAMAELHDRYVEAATRVARSICRERVRTEDAVQEAFVSVWRSAGTYRPDRGAVSTWLLQIVRNRAIDVARRELLHDARRTGAEQLVVAPAPDDVGAEACRRADGGRVVDLVAGLPRRQREALTLVYFGELTHQEVALRLGIPAGTVKGRIRAGLHALRPVVAEMREAR